jgi:hypothetical protein
MCEGVGVGVGGRLYLNPPPILSIGVATDACRSERPHTLQVRTCSSSFRKCSAFRKYNQTYFFPINNIYFFSINTFLYITYFYKYVSVNNVKAPVTCVAVSL